MNSDLSSVPEPFGFHGVLARNTKLQLFICECPDGSNTIVKHFSCPDKCKPSVFLAGTSGEAWRGLHLLLAAVGWQFAMNPSSRKVLAALEHKASESHEDRVRLSHGLFAHPRFAPDLVIHDDACHLEAYVRKHHPDSFPSVKHYIVDVFHRRNHKCSKRELTVSQKRRCNRVRTNMSESFNAWIRTVNLSSIRCGPTAVHSGLRKPVCFMTQLWLLRPHSRPDCGDAAVSRLA